MKNTEPAPRRRKGLVLLIPTILSLCIVAAILFLLLGLFPMPDGLLADLARKPELQGSCPARILLEGMAFWYRALLIFLLTVLVIAALALLWSFGVFLRHHRWCRAHRAAFRQAMDFSLLTSVDLALAVDDPWNYNGKSGIDPTPGWWNGVWEEKERCEALIEEYDSHSWSRISAFLSLTPLLLATALTVVMVLSEKVPALYEKARADMAQIEAGQCETVTVWLSPKVREWQIDGPYSSGQPALLTRYGAVSLDTGGRWTNLFVPWGMDFTLDQDKLYNENYSIQWNAEHAQMYEVRYTTELFLIQEIHPVDTPAIYFS